VESNGPFPKKVEKISIFFRKHRKKFKIPKKKKRRNAREKPKHKKYCILSRKSFIILDITRNIEKINQKLLAKSLRKFLKKLF